MMAFKLLILVLAGYRVTRFVTTDDMPLLAKIRDGAQKTLRRTLGDDWAEGLTCPWCVGTYVSAAAVAIGSQVTSLPVPVAWWLATASGIGIVARIEG